MEAIYTLPIPNANMLYMCTTTIIPPNVWLFQPTDHWDDHLPFTIASNLRDSRHKVDYNPEPPAGDAPSWLRALYRSAAAEIQEAGSFILTDSLTKRRDD